MPDIVDAHLYLSNRFSRVLAEWIVLETERVYDNFPKGRIQP
ncbi:hypothetical protein TRIP_B250058 [uncultured Desulfatiglans sp.]|nr:hypothetical protein TRIP_B250058 [uncultured Desulfatiglans sp.]